jgi:hypothetical protein
MDIEEALRVIRVPLKTPATIYYDLTDITRVEYQVRSFELKSVQYKGWLAQTAYYEEIA